jgi:hypothetical protein
MSDEGLMTDDIQECLMPVIRALKKCDLDPSAELAWCEAMTMSDKMGFICEEQLRTLQHQFAARESQ